MSLVRERLAGCTAESLDGYLRGLGFFLLAGEVEPSVRAWWDEDDVMWIASPVELEAVARRVLESVRNDPVRLRTPWRGEGRTLDFIQLRNDAEERELDWFDASTLFLSDGSRENNPLLGEGASFGRGEIAEGYEIALSSLSGAPESAHAQTLVDLVRGRATDGVPKALTIDRKILSAYQSGRATGPGSSAKDINPSSQKARTLAWDVLLILRGVRVFRGVVATRPDRTARVQAAFPLVVEARPIATGPGGVTDLRRDPRGTFELLAPLWPAPCTTRALTRLLPATRLRLPRGVVRDTLDAVLVQSARATASLGFDRLVRFALIPPDPKKPARYAARRGEVHALGVRAARLAVEQILPFLRELDRAVREEPPSLTVARRRVDDALAAFGQPRPPASAGVDATRTQEVLVALAAMQTPAARAVANGDRPVEPPRLSSEWFRYADDGSAAYRLARALVAGLSDDGACRLRDALLPQRRDENRFVLDATRTPPDLEHVSDPLSVLVELVLTALRRTRPEDLSRAGSTSFSVLASLLAGALGREGERRLALLCAALTGVYSAKPPPCPPEDPLKAGVGADVARLLLAAQPASTATSDGASAATETAKDALERTTTLASLLLAGRVDVARTMADRELRRRGLDLLPAPPRLAPTPRPQALALAVLLPFDDKARSALERTVSVLPAAT
jgi:CRISPR-associated protein Csx17